jgi:hypothetical protein
MTTLVYADDLSDGVDWTCMLFLQQNGIWTRVERCRDRVGEKDEAGSMSPSDEQHDEAYMSLLKICQTSEP